MGIGFVKFLDQNQIVSRKGIYRALPYQSLSKQPSLPLRHTTTIPSQAKDSTETERAQAAEKTEAERKKRGETMSYKTKTAKNTKTLLLSLDSSLPKHLRCKQFCLL